MSETRTIVVITAGGAYPWVIINALAENFPGLEVVQEDPESRVRFFRRRIRRIGLLQTTGQFVTMVVSRFGKRFAHARIAEIVAEHTLRTDPIAAVPVTRVPSANSSECLAAIAAADPAVVVLASCRMLKPETLAAIPCPIINYHSGITPKYRGMQGGYWARALGDPAHYGATVHLVDEGVDTGQVLYQSVVAVNPRETMLTDAFAQAAGSRHIAIAAVRDALDGKLSPQPVDLPSVQRYHPAIWTWLRLGLSRGIW